MKQGDPDGKFHSHPNCEFCNVRFFDEGKLMRHLQRKHLTCHLCEDSNHVFYSGQSELWNHMRTKHFTCEVSRCNCAFKTKKQLDNHILNNHGCKAQNDLLKKKAKEFVINYKNNSTTKSPFEPENDLCVKDKNADNSQIKKIKKFMTCDYDLSNENTLRA